MMRVITLLKIGLCLLLATVAAKAQVTVTPAFPTENDELTIVYDATKGTSGLQGATTVYMHSGAILDSPTGTSWQLVQGKWGQDDSIGKTTSLGNNQWHMKITHRPYYKATAAQQIY